jgi:hypothetical protein
MNRAAEAIIQHRRDARQDLASEQGEEPQRESSGDEPDRKGRAQQTPRFCGDARSVAGRGSRHEEE